MTLRGRVLMALLPALAVVVLLLLWGGRTVDTLGAQSQRILADNYRSVLAAQRMKESAERLDSAALFRLAGRTAEADVLVGQHRPTFASELTVEEGNLTEAGEREAAVALRAAWERYDRDYQQFMATEQGRDEVYFRVLLPEFLAVKAEADHILALNQDAMVRKSDEAAARAHAARRAWVFGSIVGILAAIGASVWVSRRVSVPLAELGDAATRVGDGNLDLRLPRTDIRELDLVVDAFNAMAERLRLYRRANQSELARAREAAQAAIESLVDPVLVFTVGGELRAANGAARRMFAIEGNARRLTGGDETVREALAAAVDAVRTTGKSDLPTDFSRVLRAGEVALLPHAMPMNDAVTGELVGVTILLQDVTRLRRLDELKGNLVQTVAHELRTPLTSLGMALHLAMDERVSGPLPPQLAELLDAGREDVRRLRAIVEDLLDLSRIQEGQLVLRRESVDPGALLREVGGPLDAIVEGDAPPIDADRARLVIALTNLATNAARHAPAGTRIRMRVLPGDPLRFEVDDAGPGVPTELRERIFERFVRGADEPAGGAGLGLFIAKEIVLAHGGRIGVTDAPGGGARFWVELPR